ncbi:MAG: hypothetical protein ACOYXT_08865 [Bacteroidota bacterium]
MPENSTFVSDSQERISVSEFKKLLFDLRNARPDIQIRFRFAGQNWYPHFVTVSILTELSNFESAREVVFIDYVERKPLIVKNLANIMQFEIESPFGVFRPFIHYTLKM